MTADPAKLKKTNDWNHAPVLFDAARVPESGRLFYGASDFKVYEFDSTAEKPEPQPFDGGVKGGEKGGHESYVTGVALAGGRLVTGGYDQRLIWWDVENRMAIRTVDAHDKWIRGVEISPDGALVASVADDMLCKLWDAETGELVRTLDDHEPMTPHHYPSMLYAVSFSPDGKLLATGDKVGHVMVWEVETGEKLAAVETPGMYTWDPKQRRHSIGGVRSVAFSHDSKTLAVGGIGKIGNIDHLGGPSRIEVFDWEAGKRLHELKDEKHKGLVEQIAFHPSGKWFLAAGGDHAGFVTFYETATGKILKQEKAPMHVHAFTFDETYETLFAVGHGKIARWELKA